MKKRFLIFLISIVFVVGLLTGCGAKVTFNIGESELSLDNLTSVESYNEYSPSEGNKLVLAYFSTDANADITAITDNFYSGESVSHLQTQSGDYNCSAVAFEETTAGINVILIFDVPSGTSGEATLYANAMGSVTENIR